MSTPTKEELEKQYEDYIAKVEASLPADMSEEDREEVVLKALDQFAAQNLASAATKATEDLTHLQDAISASSPAEEDKAAQDQITALRKSLEADASAQPAAAN